jgi:Peptidase_C39 like family
MANFQKTTGDRNTRFDTGIGRVVIMLGETAKIDLWGGGPPGTELVVDVNDTSAVAVSGASSKAGPNLMTYELKPLKSGNVMLEARVFDICPTPETRRRDWFTKPVYAYIQISVMGHDFMQSGGTWGQIKYKSTKKFNLPVEWSTMAYSGCGPTALANVLDYLFRLYAATGNAAAGITPLQTMDYSSEYGRAAGLTSGGDKMEGKGTDGNVMINNLGQRYPGYAGEKIQSVDLAVRWLRAGTPIIFLANGNTATWSNNPNGSRSVHRWKEGHYMVLLGVEDGPEDANQLFWVADPSLARTKYTSRADLQKCSGMWRVFAKP